MGSEESKTQMNHQSDAEVTIINNQNEHAEKLENHDSYYGSSLQ